MIQTKLYIFTSVSS